MVSREAKQVKAWLCDARDELEAAHAERDRLQGLLQGAEAELWSATERVDALTADWNDAADGWRAREKALLERASGADEEAAAARAESAAEIDTARQALADDNAARWSKRSRRLTRTPRRSRPQPATTPDCRRPSRRKSVPWRLCGGRTRDSGPARPRPGSAPRSSRASSRRQGKSGRSRWWRSGGAKTRRAS